MGEWRSHHSSNQSSSVSLLSTFSPPFISLSPPPNAFSGRLQPPYLRPISSLTLHLMANTSMQFPPLAHLAIPLFSSQVLIILIIKKKSSGFCILDWVFFCYGFFVFLLDYAVVLKKMQRVSENPRILGTRYMQGIADSFGGNLSLVKRLSHFDQSDDGNEIPCGFFRPFPISNHG